MLHNASLCKVWFWRATLPLAAPTNSPERGLAASQPRSDRLRGQPDCRPSHFRIPRPHPEDLAKPDQPHQLAFAPGCHAFCKQKERAAPALRSLQAGAYSRGAAAEKRQIALPEYRQGELQYCRPRLRERVGPPLYRSGAGSSPASPCFYPKPTTPQEAPKTSRALRAPNKPSTTKQTGAGQSGSGCAGCLTGAPYTPSTTKQTRAVGQPLSAGSARCRLPPLAYSPS